MSQAFDTSAYGHGLWLPIEPPPPPLHMVVTLKRLLNEGGDVQVFLNWEGGENANEKWR